jgi:hypothetical protein
MNEPVTVTATVAVWLHTTEYSGRPQDLTAYLEKGDAVSAINMLSFYGPTTKQTFSDCTRIGEADITMRLISRDEQTRLALTALQAQLEKLRSAYMQRQQEILAQISKLQALTNEAPSADEMRQQERLAEARMDLSDAIAEREAL